MDTIIWTQEIEETTAFKQAKEELKQMGASIAKIEFVMEPDGKMAMCWFIKFDTDVDVTPEKVDSAKEILQSLSDLQ